MSTTFFPAAETARVEIGEQRLSSDGERFTFVLGSCVGLCLWDEETRTGGVAHIMLPFSQGLESNPERFADRAVDLMLARFQNLGIPLERLQAKLVGGACLADSTSTLGIGEEIVEVASDILEQFGVCISHDATGGKHGCRAEFDSATGALTIDSMQGQQKIA